MGALPTNDTAIANMALGHLGIQTAIASLQNENTESAVACRKFFETSRQETIGDFAWNFAQKQVALSLILDHMTLGAAYTNPPYEYQYVYQIPSDCMRIGRIMSGLRQDTRQSRVQMKVVGDKIYTDMQYAYLQYTCLPPDDSLYPPDFALTLSYKLAFYIIPSVSAGDPFQKAPQMVAFYTSMINKAEANSMNQDQVGQDVQSEFVRCRQGTDWMWGTRSQWAAFAGGFIVE